MKHTETDEKILLAHLACPVFLPSEVLLLRLLILCHQTKAN